MGQPLSRCMQGGEGSSAGSGGRSADTHSQNTLTAAFVGSQHGDSQSDLPATVPCTSLMQRRKMPREELHQRTSPSQSSDLMQ